jgi:hypothetical protein
MGPTGAAGPTGPERPQVSFNAFPAGDRWYSPGVAHRVVFDAERHDDGNNFDTSTSAFRAPTDGVYHFEVSVYGWELSGGVAHLLYLLKNGTPLGVVQTRRYNWAPISLSIVASVKLRAGDVISVEYYHSAGSSRMVYPQQYSWFSGFQVY